MAYDPVPRRGLAESLQIQYLPLPEVLKESDILSLTFP